MAEQCELVARSRELESGMQTSNADVLRAMNMLRKCHRSPHETNQRSNYYKVEGLRPHRGKTRLGPGVLQKQGHRLLTIVRFQWNILLESIL